MLLIFGILDEADLGKVFCNAAPLTIGAMFVLGKALTRTGVIDGIAVRFEKWAGKSLARASVILWAAAVLLIPRFWPF